MHRFWSSTDRTACSAFDTSDTSALRQGCGAKHATKFAYFSQKINNQIDFRTREFYDQLVLRKKVSSDDASLADLVNRTIAVCYNHFHAQTVKFSLNLFLRHLHKSKLLLAIAISY